ncbi:MAG: hypothetical protein ABIN35_00770 [candidate division WOR-3 bacterium]
MNSLKTIKCVPNYEDQPLIIKGPSMIVNSIVSDLGHLYIDLQFSHLSNNNLQFYNFLTDIDHYVIARIISESKIWYSRNDHIPLTHVEHDFIPTIKMSSVYSSNAKSLNFKVETERIEFYDHDNKIIDYQSINPKQMVIPIMLLSNVYKDINHIWIEWDLLQLKVDNHHKPSQNKLKGCQLTDVTDEDDLNSVIDAIVDDEDIGDDNQVFHEISY